MQARAGFAAQLHELSARIQARNHRLGPELAYEALDPRHVGEGVTV